MDFLAVQGEDFFFIPKISFSHMEFPKKFRTIYYFKTTHQTRNVFVRWALHVKNYPQFFQIFSWSPYICMRPTCPVNSEVNEWRCSVLECMVLRQIFPIQLPFNGNQGCSKTLREGLSGSVSCQKKTHNEKPTIKHGFYWGFAENHPKWSKNRVLIIKIF